MIIATHIQIEWAHLNKIKQYIIEYHINKFKPGLAHFPFLLLRHTQHLPLNVYHFYTFRRGLWSIFAVRVSTHPSDYRPPPDSPHVGITLSQHLTVTPSGVPQNKPKFVVFPDYQNLIRIHWRGQSSETSPYEPQPAHSTGLRKPPGYNLEWSRVTPIQDALVTGPPAKASHHEHPLKQWRKLSSRTITGPKPPGAHLTSLGGT